MTPSPKETQRSPARPIAQSLVCHSQPNTAKFCYKCPAVRVPCLPWLSRRSLPGSRSLATPPPPPRMRASSKVSGPLGRGSPRPFPFFPIAQARCTIPTPETCKATLSRSASALDTVNGSKDDDTYFLILVLFYFSFYFFSDGFDIGLNIRLLTRNNSSQSQSQSHPLPPHPHPSRR